MFCNRERVFIELYDRAIVVGDYRFKDPTPAGREFLIHKFNQTFNCNVNYRFFKEKLDQLKRKYKKYKHLMKNSTGISVDPITSVISASDSWWKDREVSTYNISYTQNILINNIAIIFVG